jgi:hypothetical protein
MSHAGWQVIEFVSLPLDVIFLKMFNFSLIQNLHLVLRINFSLFFRLFLFLVVYSKQECLKENINVMEKHPITGGVWVACLFTHDLFHEAVSSSSIVWN